MTKTLIVVDNTDCLPQIDDLQYLTFDAYLADYPKANEPKMRVINLCDSSQYLSKGYYCSLLAEARQHKVLPSVSTINDVRDGDKLDAWLVVRPDSQLSAAISEHAVELNVYFGWTEQAEFSKLARQAFDKFPMPAMKLVVMRVADGVSAQVSPLSVVELDEHQHGLFIQRLQRFTEKVWRANTVSSKRYRWDLAILVDPEEQQPPSDKEAVKRFIKAAGKMGIHAETITAKQAAQLGEFDALFIRETTAIDHHTYRLARKAEQEGLVVIDDPTSILRCCNKVFLHDAFSYNKVPSLKTQTVIAASEEVLDALEQTFGYPMVLKMPEGSFSKGVYKVDNRDELKDKLQTLLVSSALVLVQEFLYTEYDWRIGVLNGRAIYACRYHMARKHWQIYNHGAKRFSSGGFETLPTFEVPKQVLDAAIKACAMIGKGLYGVDIKQRDNHVYVIEVNDNPSIEHGVEDKYLGNELYMLIMQEFANRLELRGKIHA